MNDIRIVLKNRESQIYFPYYLFDTTIIVI